MVSGTDVSDVGRLRHRFEGIRAVIRKPDKSKISHFGTIDDYRITAQTYVEKTQAYECLNTTKPLESLVERTNDFLRGLWVNKHLSQKQYERLKVTREEAELAHL